MRFALILVLCLPAACCREEQPQPALHVEQPPPVSKFATSPGASPAQLREWRKRETPEAAFRALMHALDSYDVDAIREQIAPEYSDRAQRLLDVVMGPPSLSGEDLDVVVARTQIHGNRAVLKCEVWTHGGGLDRVGDAEGIDIAATRFNGVWTIEIFEVFPSAKSVSAGKDD